MKYYTYNGVTTTELPKILRTPTGTISPVSEEEFVKQGGVITEDEETLTPEQREFRDSDCCVHFRSLVTSVQQETGDDCFTGGYEEWPDLKKNYPEVCEKYISLFNALDNWCKKDAGKYGWGSPEWFYICWDRQPPKKNE
jgi:hypothetical protein